MNAFTSATVSYASINTIDLTVESIIEFSKKLWEDKQNLDKKEWRQHLNLLGWTSAIAAKYIKIGKAFETFDTSKLTQIEPSTLFKITSSKRIRFWTRVRYAINFKSNYSGKGINTFSTCKIIALCWW